MKKKISIFFIILLIFSILSGCSKNEIPQKVEEKTAEERENKKEEKEVLDVSIADYFPFKENSLMYYKGVGNEYAEQKVYFDYIEKDRAQIRVSNPGTEVAKILEYKDGELREVYSEGEFYNIENLLKSDVKKKDDYEIILKEPLKVGLSWKLSDGKKRTITGVDVEIDTPYKELKVLEVTTELGNNRKQIDYYAKGIGHVASIYKGEDMEVKTLLEKLEENVPVIHRMRFYYPTKADMKVAYTNIESKFRTNDRIENLFEVGFKNPPSEKVISPISPSTKINSIILDKDSGILKVDFSKELITDMNAGSFLETEILNSLVNTFSSYYGVNKVYISTDGEPYSSGHYAISEGEYFTVDDKDIEELK